MSQSNRGGEAVIEAQDLRFEYPQAEGRGHSFRLHLEHWQVRAGSRMAVHGPSGSGKSTLLSLIAGILSPHAGTLRVAGAALHSMGEAQRRAHRIRRLGFVFQDFPLVEYLNARDNVLLPYRLSRALTLDAGARERAQALLHELGIGDCSGRLPAELSQGEQQRVAIARALVTEPDILLADEPTAGLDPDRSCQVMELLEHLCENRGLTLVLVTHELAILERFELRLDMGALPFSTD